MKVFTLLSVIFCLFIAACSGGGTDDVPQSSAGYDPPAVYEPPAGPQPPSVTVPSAEPGPPSGYVPPAGSASAVPNLVDMHYGLLSGVGFLVNESGGFSVFNVTISAAAGDTVIKVESTTGLTAGQLIVYESWSGEAYVSEVDSFTDTDIALLEPLAVDIYAGNQLSNFYYNCNHPHFQGYKAIADYALRRFYANSLDYGTHIMLGDSWFSNNWIATRFSERFQTATFINKGVAGDTVAKLLDRFDADVALGNPDFVWVMVGTNDYWQGVAAAEYLSEMQLLINKIEAIGATAIVFDPSVGPFETLEYGIHLNGELKLRSDEYADIVKGLSFSRKLDLNDMI